MKKDYYEWLEVSKKASPEIIEKAYKTLVKKYHPDLQENNQKEKSEEILKKINEAYDTLSDPEKRKLYDLSTQEQQNISKSESIVNKENLTPKKENFKYKYKKTSREYLRDLIALILTILIVLIICQIPFIKKIIINFYNDNSAFRHIVNFFINK